MRAFIKICPLEGSGLGRDSTTHVVAARLSAFWAVPSPLAAASIIIDVLMQAVTQFLFAALGLVMLVALAGDTTVTWIAATGLALAIPMLGGSLLLKLQENEEQVSTIIVSAYGDMSNIRTAMNCGAFDFVTKRIDFQDFQTTITKTLRHIEFSVRQ
jgi:DNA-binding NtrC family response regulator